MSALLSWLKDAFNNIIGQLTTVVGEVVQGFEELVETIEQAVQQIEQLLTGGDIPDLLLDPVEQVLKTIVQDIEEAVSIVLGGLEQLADDTIHDASKGVKDVIKLIIDTGMAALNELTSVINGVYNDIQIGVNYAEGIVSQVLNNICSQVCNIMEQIVIIFKTDVMAIINDVKTIITTLFNTVASDIQNGCNDFINGISSVCNDAKRIVKSGFKDLKGIYKILYIEVKNAINDIKKDAEALPTFLESNTNTMIANVKGEINQGYSEMVSAGRYIQTTVKNSAAKFGEDAKNTVKLLNHALTMATLVIAIVFIIFFFIIIIGNKPQNIHNDEIITTV